MALGNRLMTILKCSTLSKSNNFSSHCVSPRVAIIFKLVSTRTGCMRGRTMYVIPFSMGPVGGRLSKVGLQLTDSPYVVASMRIMTRIGDPVLKYVTEAKPDVVRALHSVGVPIDSASGKPIEPAPRNVIPSWPCYPDKTFIVHLPEMNEICSFGSGYGGNSLLGKKCFALRLGSILARKEGWLAEHMLVRNVFSPVFRRLFNLFLFLKLRETGATPEMYLWKRDLLSMKCITSSFPSLSVYQKS